MSSSTGERMEDIVRAARKIVKAARTGDADGVLEHALAIERPSHIIMDDISTDEWHDRTGMQQALDDWSDRRTRQSSSKETP